VKFDTEKKERVLTEQKLLIEKESRRKTQIVIGLVALSIALLIGVVFFKKRLKDQTTISTQKGTLQQNKIDKLQQKNKLQALQSMIEGQEAERFRIAKDLHDSLGGLLSTVKSHFTNIQKEIKAPKSNMSDKTNSLIDEACEEVRRISHKMVPHAIGISGLKGAIEDLGESLKLEGYHITMEIDELPKIESTKQVILYRLIQEIISNISKHSNAKFVLLQLLAHKHELSLIIEDDGKGFDYNQAINQGANGLININSCIEFLDGTINWDSELNKGTTININLPVS